jgi:hypothetical protein
MRKYKVTFTIVLRDEADTDFIENAIEEQLEKGEDIIDGSIEELLE